MIVESQLSDLDETVDVRQNTEIIGTDIDDLNRQICQLTQEVNTLHRCRKEIVSGGHVLRVRMSRATTGCVPEKKWGAMGSDAYALKKEIKSAKFCISNVAFLYWFSII